MNDYIENGAVLVRAGTVRADLGGIHQHACAIDWCARGRLAELLDNQSR